MPNLELIKKLRTATGCGIADCNKALAACNNNYEESVDWLRKKGLSSAEKKSERITTEGLVGVIIKNNNAAMLEVNSETDFVARNEKFQNLVSSMLEVALKVKNKNNFIEELKAQTINGKTVNENLADNIAVIGENLQLRRGTSLTLKGDGLIVPYIHTAISPNMGKIAVLVVLESGADKNLLQELGKKIAMHIAATKPEFLNKESVPAENVKREKDVLIEQARNSGKPENIIEKMIEGRMEKFYEEVCLLEQPFVMDDKMKVYDLLNSFKKETGKEIKIQEYCLYVLGEGLEKKSFDFAEEVASITK